MALRRIVPIPIVHGRRNRVCMKEHKTIIFMQSRLVLGHSYLSPVAIFNSLQCWATSRNGQRTFIHCASSGYNLWPSLPRLRDRNRLRKVNLPMPKSKLNCSSPCEFPQPSRSSSSYSCRSSDSCRTSYLCRR